MHKKILTPIIAFATIIVFANAQAADTKQINSAVAGIDANATTTINDAKIKAAYTSLKSKNWSSSEADRSIKALERLSARVQAMEKIAPENKNSILAQLESLIANLTDLRNQSETGTGADSGREKKIANNYQLYALVMPQGYIVASSDRINAMAQKLESLGVKLATSIGSVATTKNAPKLQTEIASLNVKIADAKAKAVEARNKAMALVSDGGDAAMEKNNIDALSAAKELVKSAASDLNEARLTANNIAKELRSLGMKTSVGYGSGVIAGNASSTIPAPAKPEKDNATPTKEK